MAIIIETERLILRTLKIEDLDKVVTFWGNAEVMKYCGGSSGDKNQIKEIIKYYINFQSKKGYSPYAVVLKEIDKVIGACGFNPTQNGDEIELIYHFSNKYWGKGYATEAGKACINYARENLKINKIIASVDPNHISSRKILEKLGFEYIGMKWFKDTNQEEPYFELVIE